MKIEKSIQFQSQISQRLDKFLSVELNITRNKAVQLIENNQIKVDEKNVKPSFLLKIGSKISICLEELDNTSIRPENIPLSIIFENQDFMIINKPRGMLVHPAGHTVSGTLVNALMHHTKDLSSHYGLERAGIIHRIDKDTTGLLIVTKNDKIHQYFAELFQSHRINKYYIALVHGVFPQEKASILLPIEKDPKNRKVKISPIGKCASTSVVVMERFQNYTLLEVQIHTGRTHQIRIHLSHIGFPIVGDSIYGSQENDLAGQLLHSYKISFPMPITKVVSTFECSIPDDFDLFLQHIRK